MEIATLRPALPRARQKSRSADRLVMGRMATVVDRSG
jgi:hypothetical protein